MELFDKTFWRMTSVFLFVVLFGIGSLLGLGFLNNALSSHGVEAGYQDHL